MVEWYVGDNMLSMTDDPVRAALTLFNEALR